MQSKISVVLITHNSEKFFDAVLSSVQSFADEIIVVDDESVDQTLNIAQKYNAKIFKRKMQGFGAQKQFALDQTSNDWVFVLDSDEIVSKELAAEIVQALKLSDVAAVALKRKNYYFGRWLKHGGKFPDWQTRLLNKKFCRFSQDIVHEKVLVQGTIFNLTQSLDHYSYPDLETWLEKLQTFVFHRGQELQKKYGQASIRDFLKYVFWRPLTRFVRRYIFKGAFLDGLPGFLACLHDALTEILGYVYWIQLYSKK